jgi:hypothetical protein
MPEGENLCLKLETRPNGRPEGSEQGDEQLGYAGRTVSPSARNVSSRGGRPIPLRTRTYHDPGEAPRLSLQLDISLRHPADRQHVGHHIDVLLVRQ